MGHIGKDDVVDNSQFSYRLAVKIVFPEAAGIRMGQMRLNFQASLSFMKSVSSKVGSEGEHSVRALRTVTALWISFHVFPNKNILSYSLLASKVARASFYTPALSTVFLSSH